MSSEYYTLPLSAVAIIKKREHPKCSLRQSVAQQLHLLLTTGLGEIPMAETFGCNIWDHDFDNLTSGTRFKEAIRQSLLQAVREHETRISNVQVELRVRQEELLEDTTTCRIKKRVDVGITGILLMTNETFTYNDSFFVGPLSY